MKTQEEIIYELGGALKRLIEAAKPHCHSNASQLFMRITEGEAVLKDLEPAEKLIKDR